MFHNKNQTDQGDKAKGFEEGRIRNGEIGEGEIREGGKRLKIQHSQTTTDHPQSNGMLECFHRRLKDALRARCAAANWVDHLPWVLLGLRAAAREDDGSIPAQAVFGSPLILPGQFLDSPELPSLIFLEQFSKTLSAAEHTSTRHNTAATRQPPSQLPDDLAHALTVFLRWNGHVPPLQPLYDGPYAVLRSSLHHFMLRIGQGKGQGLHPPTQTLHRPYSATRAAQGQGPTARRHPLPGFSPARGCGGPPGTLRPTAANRTGPGTVFPWPAARGFCTPRRRSRPTPPPACNRREPSRLDLKASVLEAWGEPCEGS